MPKAIDKASAKPFDLFEGEEKPQAVLSIQLPTHDVTASEYATTYLSYPELAPDPLKVCGFNKGRCKNHAMRFDISCIKHTRKSLEIYDIPWMCTGKKKNNKRCTQIVLEGKNLCVAHYKKELDFQVTGEVALTKTEIHKLALLSPNVEDWRKMLFMTVETPVDLVKVLEETLNRYRFGSINKEQVVTISSLSKRILEILVTSKEAGLNEVLTAIPDKRWEEDVSNVLSFKDKLAKMAKKRESVILQTETEDQLNARNQ